MAGPGPARTARSVALLCFLVSCAALVDSRGGASRPSRQDLDVGLGGGGVGIGIGIGGGSPSSPSPTPPSSQPQPCDFENERLYRAYLVIQQFRSTVTCDPMGVTQSWSGTDVQLQGLLLRAAAQRDGPGHRVRRLQRLHAAGGVPAGLRRQPAGPGAVPRQLQRLRRRRARAGRPAVLLRAGPEQQQARARRVPGGRAGPHQRHLRRHPLQQLLRRAPRRRLLQAPAGAGHLRQQQPLLRRPPRQHRAVAGELPLSGQQQVHGGDTQVHRPQRRHAPRGALPQQQPQRLPPPRARPPGEGHGHRRRR
uniref:Uncharacterized protein n=1 Tax=Zea mays TaxID=4577 RepID=B4FW70_MAIZE|nr:unknown [Zea mays]